LINVVVDILLALGAVLPEDPSDTSPDDSTQNQSRTAALSASQLQSLQTRLAEVIRQSRTIIDEFQGQLDLRRYQCFQSLRSALNDVFYKPGVIHYSIMQATMGSSDPGRHVSPTRGRIDIPNTLAVAFLEASEQHRTWCLVFNKLKDLITRAVDGFASFGGICQLLEHFLKENICSAQQGLQVDLEKAVQTHMMHAGGFRSMGGTGCRDKMISNITRALVTSQEKLFGTLVGVSMARLQQFEVKLKDALDVAFRSCSIPEQGTIDLPPAAPAPALVHVASGAVHVTHPAGAPHE